MHFDSVASSVKRVTGFEVTLAGVAIHGSTDTAILREACRQAGIPAEVLEPQVEAILEAMCDNVAERRHEMDLDADAGRERRSASPGRSAARCWAWPPAIWR